MKPGDTVTFHMVPMHLCSGGGAEVIDEDVKAKRASLGLTEKPVPGGCKCILEAAVQLEATVITVYELEKGQPQALELEVSMPDDVLALGYASRQSCSYEAATSPPESGTWTQ